MSILQEISNNRRRSIPKQRDFRHAEIVPNELDFKKALKSENGMHKKLIAEIKRKSPSKGDIRANLTVRGVIEWYKPYAAAVSVLTEPDYFGGSLDDLRTASELCSIPLLRKDFLTDPIQVKEARVYGASAYLLIVGILSRDQLREMIECGREWNMHALVEVHDEAELEEALDSDIDILGINNRDLRNLQIDLTTTDRLLKLIPENIQDNLRIVSESGISTRAEVLSLPKGVDAILVGSSIMGSDDPVKKLTELVWE